MVSQRGITQWYWVIVRHTAYRRSGLFALVYPFRTTGSLLSIWTTIWDSRTASYYRQGNFTYTAVSMVNSLLQCGANAVIFCPSYNGAFQLFFPLSHFSPLNLPFFAYCFLFVIIRLFFFPWLPLHRLQVSLRVAAFKMIRSARWCDKWTKFVIVLEARRFAPMRLPGDVQTVCDERNDWVRDTTVGDWKKH